MARSWRSVLVLGFALWLSLGSAVARAQDDLAQSASARALFEEGVKFADAARWPEAADRFQRALSLRDSPVIRFNLAAALGQQGQLVSASELLQQVLRAENAEPTVKAQAEQLLAQLTPRLARLSIRVEPSAAELSVELDGRTLAPAQVGVALPMDPGLHRARLMHADEELDAHELELAPGQSHAVTLRGRLSPSEVAAAAVAAPSPPTAVAPTPDGRRTDASPSRRKTWLWVGVGTGAALVIGAVVTGVLLAQRSDDPAQPYRGDFEPGSVQVKVTP